MRLGLIADVHANIVALEVALRAIEKERVDQLLCAGDLVGYGPFPNECVARLRAAGATCVAGNHDLMATEQLGDAAPGTLPNITMTWTRSVLEDDTRAYLAELPPMAEVAGLVMAHGSLDDPTVYVRREQAGAALQRLAEARPAASILLLGHTHTPLAYSDGRGTLVDGRRGRVALEARDRLLVNPGSVGQPREWRPLIRFAVIDLDRGTVDYRAARYDHRSVTRALKERGLPPDACHRRPPLGVALRRALRGRRRI
jgi:predicted phosphodiesterase